MNPKTNDATETSDREFVLTRLLNAPRSLVFEAWTNPEHIANWWGPNGFTTTIAEMDVGPGGLWRYTMHGPEGVDYPNRIVYIEVVKPERLVYWHGGDEENDPLKFHVIVTFEDQGGKTTLTMRGLFATAEQWEQTKAFGAIEGGNQTLARLEDYLPTMPA